MSSEEKFLTTSEAKEKGTFIRKEFLRQELKKGNPKVRKHPNGKRWLIAESFLQTVHDESLKMTEDVPHQIHYWGEEKYYGALLKKYE